MIVFLLVVPLTTALFVALLLAIPTWVGAQLGRRRVMRDLHARAQRGDGVVLLRGRLSIEGDGCEPEPGESQRHKIAARTHWGSIRRYWLTDPVPSSNDRAANLWLQTPKEKVEIRGALAVELGSVLRASGGASFVDRRKRFDVSATLADDDDVLLVGKRHEEGDGGDAQGGYRKGATRGILEVLPETGYLVAAAVSSRSFASPLKAIFLRRVVLSALVIAVVPAVGAAQDYDAAATRLASACLESGECHVDVALRWKGTRALRDIFRSKFFVLRAHDATECIHSRQCLELGFCSLLDGSCKAITDADCRLSAACLLRGACSAVDRLCTLSKDAECEKRPYCKSLGLCSARDGSCVAATDADCRRSDPCWRDGSCAARGGQCVAQSDEDCAGSGMCNEIHHCTAREGNCVASNDDCAASPECRSIGDCTAGGDMCRPGRDVDCAESDACVSFRKCRFQRATFSCEEDAPSCAASKACLVYGRCGGEDMCIARSDRDCAQSTRCKTDHACKSFGGECAASCETTEGCRKSGSCTLGKGACIAASDADCLRSEGCKEDGRCASVGGVCKATDTTCAKTAHCRIDGRCSADRDGIRCLVSKTEDCKASETCRHEGACTADNGSCRILRDSDCESRPECVEEGHCTFSEGTCVIGAKDCQRLTACKELGLCSRSTGKYGVCEASTSADCRESEACKRFGWCDAVAGRCFVR